MKVNFNFGNVNVESADFNINASDFNVSVEYDAEETKTMVDTIKTFINAEKFSRPNKKVEGIINNFKEVQSLPEQEQNGDVTPCTNICKNNYRKEK